MKSRSELKRRRDLEAAVSAPRNLQAKKQSPSLLREGLNTKY
jgi:hypothetical protein